VGSPNPLRATPVTLDTSLAAGVLVFRSMIGQERLSQLFVYQLEVTSTAYAGTGADLIGQPVAVHFEHEGGTRHFSALVADFEQGAVVGNYASYTLTLRPWFWLLTQVHNSRIFQDKSIPDIVKGILRDGGLTDFEEHLFGSYLPREMVVQYCESDFNFISRLLEEEGIYYFFRHEEGKHLLVFADSQSSHEAEPDTKELPYYPPDRHRSSLQQYVDSWATTQRQRPDTFATRSYDFKHPKADLDGKRVESAESAITGLEVYEYPSPHLVKDQGEDYARRRLEELQANLRTISAGTNAPNLLLGRTFKLTDHPVEGENAEYLVIGNQFSVREPELESSQGEDAPTYYSEFEAMPHSRPYRPRRLTPKPYMRGPQTARVVTSGDEDLASDEFGRIHVKFHWDRFAKNDQTASAWVRVAQMWAGASWGSQFIPRVNMEVVVVFLEGDPDCPLVTGCVYNGDNAPPYAANTQSGIKSRSTKGGGTDNFNEIRFEDLKGSEELHIQAEKTMSTLVKKDRSASVGGSDSVSVSGDRSLSVNGNLSVSVKGNGSGPTQSSHSVTGKHALDASDEITITAPNKITLTVGSTTIVMTPSAITLTASDSQVTIDPNIFAKSSGNSTLMLDPNACLTASGQATVLLDDHVLAASAQSASVMLDANVTAVASSGDVAISGMNVSATGKMKATIGIGASAVECSPPGTTVSGAMVNVNGNAMVSIAAPMIKIG